MNTLLDTIYRDISNPAGLGSVQKLYNEGRKRNKNLTLKDVKSFLEGNRTYTLHKTTRKKFPRRKILAPKPRVIVSCDLGDFSALQKHNRGVKYVMFCLDVFSRFLQVFPLTSKSAKSSLSALRTILESDEFKGVSRVFTDLGTEFYNNEIKKYLSSKRMTLYSNYSRETKASLAERVIKTIKSKIYKYLTHNNTLTYIDILPTLIDTYNNTHHRGLDATPAQVHRLSHLPDIKKQFRLMYLSHPTDKKAVSSQLSVGDIVRLQLLSRTQFKFNKAYKINNTEELFKIRRVDTSQKIPVYYLRDLADEDVKGAFYREELTKSSLPDQFHVDVLRTKTDKGEKKVLRAVAWLPQQIQHLDKCE